MAVRGWFSNETRGNVRMSIKNHINFCVCISTVLYVHKRWMQQCRKHIGWHLHIRRHHVVRWRMVCDRIVDCYGGIIVLLQVQLHKVKSEHLLSGRKCLFGHPKGSGHIVPWAGRSQAMLLWAPVVLAVQKSGLCISRALCQLTLHMVHVIIILFW